MSLDRKAARERCDKALAEKTVFDVVGWLGPDGAINKEAKAKAEAKAFARDLLLALDTLDAKDARITDLLDNNQVTIRERDELRVRVAELRQSNDLLTEKIAETTKKLATAHLPI